MIAMIDMGPSPGSIPMKVPMMQPPTTISIFCIDSAVFSPIRNPSIMAMNLYGF